MEPKRTILLVDDDVDISQLVKMMLEKTGLYTVSVCNSPTEAFKVIQTTRPELVLLDVMMPDVDGPEIAERIRGDASLKTMRVAFMTSLVSQTELGGNPMIGGHPFISKPINRDILLQRVKGFFETGT